MVRQYPPLCVVDWNIIRAQKADDCLPDNTDILIPDAILMEVAQSHITAGLRRVFVSWSKRNRHRIHVGHYWTRISRAEVSPTCSTSVRQIISHQLTNRFRHTFKRNADTLIERFSSFSNGLAHTEYQALEHEFCAMAQDGSEAFLQAHPKINLKAATEEIVTKYIQSANPYDWVAPSNTKHSGAAWQAPLAIFPDKLAVGRWMRLVTWYRLEHVQGKTRKFGNNWADAHYLFLASYAGNLFTGDKRMMKAAETVFPQCHVTFVDPT